MQSPRWLVHMLCTDSAAGLGDSSDVLWLLGAPSYSHGVPRGTMSESRQFGRADTTQLEQHMTGIFGRGHTGTTAPAMPPQAPVPAPPVAEEVQTPTSAPVPFARTSVPPEAVAVEPAVADETGVLEQVDGVVEEVEPGAVEMPLGPTGPADAAVPRPVAGDRAHPRPRDLDVQPEGRGRQDHDHHQPRRLAGGVRPQGAAGRLRPPGVALGGPGAEPARDRAHRLQPADGPRRHPRRRRRADRRTGDGPAAVQHRPVRRRGAAGPRGRPRADAAARAGPGDRPATT